ncbi:MAG: NYN domain-containing protein [Acidobacteriota bacterium]
MSQQERLNIAVFIDFDNIEIGVKSTLNEHFDVGNVLDAIKERGEVVTKIAYADWTRAGEYSRHLTQHAIRLVQRNLTPGGDKNGADINLALDALEMVFTHQHINAYVIVGGDSDFLSLVEKLKQYDKKVFVVGGRAFTSVILQRNCHEFIAYENLNRSRKPVAKGDRPVASVASAPIAQAFPIVRRALKILSDREVSPQTGLLKSTLLQLDSTFSERNYGASSFLDFVEKLAKSGLVTMKQAGRSVMVELNSSFDEGDQAIAKPAFTAEVGADAVGVVVAPPLRLVGEPSAGSPDESIAMPPVQNLPPAVQIGTNADGVRVAGDILKAATNARWPMYLRNVKQILRAYRSDGPDREAGFDERQYGFSGLMELLRACQREGLVRVERDRRGGLRVFPAQGLQRTGQPQIVSDEQPRFTPPQEVLTEEQDNIGNVLEPAPPIIEEDTEEPAELVVMPIDTTAELLGRAKHKRPARTRAALGTTPAAPRGTRKTAVRKPAARRPARAKKSSGSSD